MKRNEDDDERFVTISDRRSGIYKKAIELQVTLCGDGIGILVFPPAGKPFSYGHPSIESITNRCLRRRSLLRRVYDIKIRASASSWPSTNLAQATNPFASYRHEYF